MANDREIMENIQKKCFEISKGECEHAEGLWTLGYRDYAKDGDVYRACSNVLKICAVNQSNGDVLFHEVANVNNLKESVERASKFINKHKPMVEAGWEHGIPSMGKRIERLITDEYSLGNTISKTFMADTGEERLEPIELHVTKFFNVKTNLPSFKDLDLED